MFALIEEDHIKVVEDSGKEVVGWHRDEWMEDPQDVVPAIANAIRLAYEDPSLLRGLLKINKNSIK